MARKLRLRIPGMPMLEDSSRREECSENAISRMMKGTGEHYMRAFNKKQSPDRGWSANRTSIVGRALPAMPREALSRRTKALV